jgi:hypothetical protein
MRTVFAILILAVGVQTILAQKSDSATATACSIANTGSNVSNLTVQCGIGKAQGATIIKMLNEILAAQNPDKILAQLEPKLIELLAADAKPSVEQSGAGNQQTVIPGTVTQSNGGSSCNQQVVGGNNNTNVCATPSRELTEDQKSKLAVAAEEIPKTVMVVVISADDAESQEFAEEIRQVFVAHGTTRARGTNFGWHPKGIWIVINPEEDGLVAGKLAYEMNQFGFPFKQVDVSPRTPKGEIHIVVGDE